MYLGIDLSHHNGNVDMKKVKADGYEYTIVRAGYGKNNTDRKYNRNIQQCIDADMPYGIYWFSYAYSVEMARKEAMYSIQALNKYKNSGVIAYDFEYDSMNYMRKQGIKPTKQLITAMAKAFLEEVSKHGFIPMLYTNDDYEKNYFDMKQFDCDIWYARYKNSISNKEKSHCSIWQKSSDGRVNGINGKVDINECYVEFRDIADNNKVEESKPKEDLIELGLQHAYNFIGGVATFDVKNSNIFRVKKAVLQHAINLDYNSGLVVDGLFGRLSEKALGNHYVKRSEKQYMVTAAEILMYLNNIDPNGVELVGIYGKGLTKASAEKLNDDGNIITAEEFLELIK